MVHQNRRANWFTGLCGVAALSVLSSCGGQPEQDAAPQTSPQAVRAVPGSRQTMVVYSPDEKVDASGLQDLGPPEALGGEVLSGSPRLYGRVDHSGRGMTAGVFKATSGRVRIHFPFTEHATILEGEVTITDEATNQAHTFRKGDSYFIRQGQVVIWDVSSGYVIKSFFNYAEPSAK